MAKATDKAAKGAADDGDWGEAIEADFPEVWEPREGDSIAGIYCGSDEVPSPRTDARTGKTTFTAYRLETKDGMMSFSGAMLTLKMEKIPVGTRIRVTYDGMESVGAGEAKQYTVVPAKGARVYSPREVAMRKAQANGQAPSEAGASAGGSTGGDKIPF